jgi:proteasome accessory factor A
MALLEGVDSPLLSEPCVRLEIHAGSGYNPQDWGRRFLAGNGGCAYIDLDHLELCIPEVQSARDHLAATHAMLRVARQALDRANRRLAGAGRVVALANNTDGLGHSYGSHLNFLVTRRLQRDLFDRRWQPLLVLASYQVSSLVFTGQGKVGSENGRPEVPYQLSQRADHIESLQGAATTHNRPLINTRDEALCGGWRESRDTPPLADMARLHVIFHDQTLCHVASMLKVGILQIILSMLETGWCSPALILEDPLAALGQWSRDPSLKARAPLASGRSVTAVELQMEFLAEAARFVEAGRCDAVVPEARFLLELWADTLHKLARRDLAALAGRIDWVLKLQLLERVLAQRHGMDWSSPQLRHLDFMYSSLEDGLYFACERQGAVERLVPEESVDRFLREPPPDTRAWTRAMLLRMAEPEAVDRVDWDTLTFRVTGSDGWSRPATVSLANPLGFTREICLPVFESSHSLEEALEFLEAPASGRLQLRDAPGG